MIIWNILGIEPTSDIKSIRKAYAQKLKLYHPEDDPVGYQRLREAYDAAMNYSKVQLSSKPEAYSEPDNSEDTGNDCDPFNTADVEADQNNTPPASPVTLSEEYNSTTVSIQEQNDQFLKQVEELYDNFFLRIDIKRWEELLNADAVWVINNREYLNDRLLDYFHEHHFLPQNVWQLFDRNFNWLEKENSLSARYPEAFFNYMKVQVNQSNPLRYCYFKEDTHIDFDKFLDHREKAYIAFSNKDLPDTLLNINKAKEIYERDPDLLSLEAEYSLRLNKTVDALRAMNAYLEILPDDPDMLFKRAEIFYNTGRTQNALDDLLKIEVREPATTKIDNILGNCYFKLLDYRNAKEYLLKAKVQNPSDPSINSTLSKATRLFYRQLRSELKKAPDVRLKLEYINLKKEIKLQKKLETKKFFQKNKTGLIIVLILAASLSLLYILNDHGDKGYQHSAVNDDLTNEIINEIKDMDLKDYEPDLAGVPYGSNISINLSDVTMLDLLSACIGPEGNETRVFVHFQSGKELSTSIKYEGRVYLGTIENKKIIFIAVPMINNGESVFACSGTVLKPSKGMISAVEEQLKIAGISPDGLIVDKYMLMDLNYKPEQLYGSCSQGKSLTAMLLPVIAAVLIINGVVKYRSRQ